MADGKVLTVRDAVTGREVLLNTALPVLFTGLEARGRAAPAPWTRLLSLLTLPNSALPSLLDVDGMLALFHTSRAMATALRDMTSAWSRTPFALRYTRHPTTGRRVRRLLADMRAVAHAAHRYDALSRFVSVLPRGDDIAALVAHAYATCPPAHVAALEDLWLAERAGRVAPAHPPSPMSDVVRAALLVVNGQSPAAPRVTFPFGLRMLSCGEMVELVGAVGSGMRPLTEHDVDSAATAAWLPAGGAAGEEHSAAQVWVPLTSSDGGSGDIMGGDARRLWVELGHGWVVLRQALSTSAFAQSPRLVWVKATV